MLLSNIFYSLIYSKTYFDKVIPHLDERYFTEKEHIVLFKKIREYYMSSNQSKQPKLTDIRLMIEVDTNISERDTENVYEFIEHLKTIDRVSDEELLVKETENYCKQRALENAILDSVEIIQSKKESVGKIEDKIKQALAVEFDVKIGTDFFKDAVNRYNAYIEEEEIIPTDIDLLNQLLNGGFRRKAIAAFLGRTNIGKSLILCHLASAFMKQGYNVLYVSGEMSETMIGRRIDANILDLPANSFDKTLDKRMYLDKIKNILAKQHGKLIIKEYPTGGANALHIKNLINEIQQKKGYTPDVLILDYLNIFGSHRLGSQAASNSYNYIKAVCEEMRGLAVEFNLALVTATQTNREGSNKGTEMGMDSISESFGTAMTLDWLCGINQSPEMFDKKRYIFKNLKSRYDSNINQCVTVGIDYTKMRLLNLGDEDQEIPQHIKDKLKYDQQQQDNNDAFNDLDFS